MKATFAAPGPWPHARTLAALLLATLPLLLGRAAAAATRVHALVIGNNGAFVGPTAGAASTLQPLKYADDDAAAFYELVSQITDSAELLTVMDGDTQALYPSVVSRARVPTVAAVRSAVQKLTARIQAGYGRGDRNVVFVFFSGHGAVDYGGRPALALFDGGLSHDFLYREVLEELPADELHLLIDACHAEAVVRPRDAEGEVVEVSAARANAFLVESTLARFPHVGALIAATTNAKAHEWDAIRHGIFTHELLSALRGAADVNRDRRIEYSEVYAFMAAANREVRDARARLAIVARPPETNRRTALLELSKFPRKELAWLSGVPGRYGIIEVGDERGRRLATLHGDRDFVADLLLPAGATLYVRGGEREARFSAGSGEVVAFQRLRFGELASRERGALDDAVRRGLFAAQYGRSYYDGVVDQMPGLSPVDFPAPGDSTSASFWSESVPPLPGTFKLVLGGGVSTGVAEVFPITHGALLGLRPAAGNGPALSLGLLRASDPLLEEWRIEASAGWLWSLEYERLRGWAGGMLGGGLLNQIGEDLPARRSAALSAGPVLGVSTELAGNFGIWSELKPEVLFLRRDNRWVLSLAPSGWLGASLRL